MSSLRNRPELSDADVATARAIGAADGRALRRERNMDAVREAILDLLSDGEPVTLAAIAERAGVATRSVYRYFGDLDAAISDAIEVRTARAIEVFRSEPPFSRSTLPRERLAMLVLRRIRLDRLVEPIGCRLENGGFTAHLDAEVRAAFAPELDDADEEVARVLCGMFRLRAVRAIRDVCGDDDQVTGAAMMRAAAALLFPR